MNKFEKIMVEEFGMSINTAYNMGAWGLVAFIFAGTFSLIFLISWGATPIYTGEYITGEVHEVTLRDAGERAADRVLVVRHGSEYEEFYRPPATIYYSVAEGDSVILCLFKERAGKRVYYIVSLTVGGCPSAE